MSLDAHDGIVCPRTVQVRRVAFHGYEPGSFQHAELRITRLEPEDEERMAGSGTLEAYLDDKENYSNVPFKPKLKPTNGWAMPYVTGHRYRIHWGSGLDFTRMKVEVSERWEEIDRDIYFNTNFTDTREAINVTAQYGIGDQVGEGSLARNYRGSFKSGDNHLQN